MIETLIIGITWVLCTLLICIFTYRFMIQTVALNGHKERLKKAEDKINVLMTEIHRVEEMVKPEQQLRAYRGSKAIPPNL